MISAGFLSSWPSWACARASRTRHRDVRRGVPCWASRRFILGFLAIQRVDGPSLAMLTHPSNSSSFLGVTRPGPLSCRAGHPVGLFFVTPRRVLVRAATRITRLRGLPWRRHSGTTPRSGGAAGIPLTSSGSGLKQSAFAPAFSRLEVVAHRCTTSATSPLGRGGVPQDRAQTRRLS